MTRTGGGSTTPLENRVRDAIRAKAAEVPPEAVPPLRLPARRSSFSLPHGGRERERGPAGRSWATRAGARRAWVTPLAGAAGVAAALALVFALGGVIHPGRPASGHPSGLAALPRYYVALNFTNNGQCCGPKSYYNPWTHAVVRVTTTGRALATIDPPRPYGTFVGVTAAADDRTFVLAAQKVRKIGPTTSPPATRFYLLRLTPPSSTSPARALLTPLPIRALSSNTSVWDFALSPDGTRLAVVSGVSNLLRLSVVNVATGATRTWKPGGVGNGQALNQNSLSWAAGGRRLAFLYWGPTGRAGLRVLDLAAPGSSLVANSRLIAGQPSAGSGVGYWIQAQLTPDGQAVMANRDPPGGKFSQQLVEFSARTGKVTRVLSDISHLWGDDEQVHWMSPDGRVLIVTDAVAAHDHSRASFADVDAGMLTDGHYTPLPWSDRTFTAAW
jgi:Lipoprotein LpqB beta-propeller domain